MIQLTNAGEARVGSHAIEQLAAEHGTPFYLYDLPTMTANIQQVRAAFGPSVRLLYAAKANPNLHLLRALSPLVDGLDISSAGELTQALAAGYEASRLGFAGPGKTDAELEAAVTGAVGIISAESMRELSTLAAIARRVGVRAPIMLRVNPKLTIREFALKMGGRSTPFGLDEEELSAAAAFVRSAQDALDMRGVHVYAGTQCLDEDALARNIENTLDIAARVQAEHGLPVAEVNLGGGFGVSYFERGPALDLTMVARRTRDALGQYRERAESEPVLTLELGRFIVGPAGVYVTRVLSEKVSRGKTHYVLDGGMNHHLAASGNLGARLRQNYLVQNLTNPTGEPVTCNLAGALCTPLDVLGAGVQVPCPRVGDLIAVLNSGSYGLTASPLLFLGHPTPAELLHDGTSVALVRPRFTISDFNG